MSILEPVKKDHTESTVKGCKIPNGLQSQVQELQNVIAESNKSCFDWVGPCKNAKNKTAELLILWCGFLFQTASVSKEWKVAEAVTIFK